MIEKQFIRFPPTFKLIIAENLENSEKWKQGKAYSHSSYTQEKEKNLLFSCVFFTFFCVELLFVSQLGSHCKCSVVSCSVGKMPQIQRQRAQSFFAEPALSQVSWRLGQWGTPNTCCRLQAAKCWVAEKSCLPSSQT